MIEDTLELTGQMIVMIGLVLLAFLVPAWAWNSLATPNETPAILQCGKGPAFGTLVERPFSSKFIFEEAGTKLEIKKSDMAQNCTIIRQADE